MSEDKERKILTWTRIRAKGEPEFYDPNTDILKLFPCAAEVAARYLQSVMAGDEKKIADLDYLFRCFQIFRIRVAEDKTPVDEQLAEYKKAIAKADPEMTSLWRATLFQIQAGLYALMCRRYAAMDKVEAKRLAESVRLGLLKDLLSKETYDKVKSELGAASKLLEDDANISGGAIIRCDETGDIIDNAKEVVAVLLADPSSGAGWNEVAEACDKEFNEASGLDDNQAICLALAYPSYDHNDLKVKQDG